MIIVRNTTSFSYPENYIILEKDFSILSKIRGKLAHKITTSIVNDINTIPVLVENIRTPKRIKLGKSVRTGLYKAAKKSGARISPINVGGPVTVTKDLAPNILSSARRYPNSRRILRKYQKRALENNVGKYQIVLGPRPSGEAVAHEIGHVINQESKNPVVRRISRISANPEVRKRHDIGYDLVAGENNPGNHGRSGIKNLVRDFIDSKSILSDEKRASRNGIKLLKNLGADKETIAASKANMDTAQEIYRRKGNVNWKTTLRNTIQTKDKRTGDIFYD